MTAFRHVVPIVAGLLLFLLGRASPALQVTRGPYLQIGTPTSVVVRWRTDAATDSFVMYGAAPGSLTLLAGDPLLTTEHEVTLTALDADTKYYYSIGTSATALVGDDFRHFFITSPVPGAARPAHIWILGDAGTKDASQRAVRDAFYSFTGSRHTDLWLMLGDNAYSNGLDTEYQLAVFDMYPETLRRSVLWPTRGNHDRGPRDALGNWTNGETYYNVFSLPRAGEAGGMASGTEVYYSFDYGNVHFICLESTLSVWRALDSPMWTWLREDLLANNKHWTIAFWHHPPYSKGSHNSDSEIELREMRERALPMLEDVGVDLVLTGHSHSYERSFLLDQHYGSSTTLTNAMKLDAGNGRVDGTGAYSKVTLGPNPHEGAVYVVAGSSGKTSGGTLNHPVMVASFNLLGSVVLDIDGNQLDAKFINVNGAVQDYFTMLKGSALSGPATQLVMVAGNDQIDRIGATLPLPFVVEARDANNLPVAGVEVSFEVVTGQGSISNSQPQLTGPNGRAATTLTLGTTAGLNTVTATAAGLAGSPIAFDATGVAPVQASLTVNVVGSGTVTLDPPGGIYDKGTDVTLTAVPAAGWSFSSWSEDLSGTANPATITMSADRSVTATFTELIGGGGMVTHEETRTGGSSSSVSVTTSTALSGVSGQLYLAAIASKNYKPVTAVSGLGLT
ncbi:MAG: metallophosphoesterase, partial [Chromatiales bacterium]